MHAESSDTLSSMVGQLAVDSKRLIVDEVRLGFLQLDEGARGAARGLAGIAAAFGIAVIAATATTVLLALLLGKLAGGLWIGFLITGATELLAAMFLLGKGRATIAAPVKEAK